MTWGAMTQLPEFALETYFARWEFTARYNLTASDAQAVSLARLLELAGPADRAEWESLSLGYTPVRGAPSLREAIAATYDVAAAADIMTFVPGEAITSVMRALLAPGDHVVTVLPTYPSAENVPRSLCEVTGVPLRPEDGWDLDTDAIAAALRPSTRLIAVNFPNNPTGAVPSPGRWRADRPGPRARPLPVQRRDLPRCRARPGPGAAPGRRPVRAGDLAGRPVQGLWPARPADRLDRLPRPRGAGPGRAREALRVDLQRRAQRGAGPDRAHGQGTLLAATRDVIARNRPVFAEFFARHADLFTWSPPEGGCVCYPRYLGPDGVEAFCRTAVEDGGVLLLPASVYASALAPLPDDRFRVGLGRADAPESLAALEEFLDRRG